MLSITMSADSQKLSQKIQDGFLTILSDEEGDSNSLSICVRGA